MFTQFPAKVDHFVVNGKLGAGAMGTVYDAYEPALDRKVALKFLEGQLAEDSQIVERFVREAKSVARLQHPNVVAVYFAGIHDGLHYYAMEHVDGVSLDDIIEQGPLEPEKAIDYLRQAASGLSAAWKCDLVHRDVKPGNLLLTNEGLIKVADFGIAKVLGAEKDLTATGVVVGTPHFLSPEQAKGMELDCRSDIYSLGATFYYLLSGSKPFDAEVVTQVIIDHITKPLIPLRQRARNVPIHLCRIIERMLGKDPRYRFQSYEELIAAIDKLAIKEELSATIAGGIKTPAKLQCKSKASATLITGTVTKEEVPVVVTPEAKPSRWRLSAVVCAILFGLLYGQVFSAFHSGAVLTGLPREAPIEQVKKGIDDFQAKIGERNTYLNRRAEASFTLALQSLPGANEKLPADLKADKSCWSDSGFSEKWDVAGGRLFQVADALKIDLHELEPVYEEVREVERGLLQLTARYPCRIPTVNALRRLLKQELEARPPAAQWRKDAIVHEILELEAGPGMRQTVALYQNLLMTMRLARIDPRRIWQGMAKERPNHESAEMSKEWDLLERAALALSVPALEMGAKKHSHNVYSAAVSLRATFPKNEPHKTTSAIVRLYRLLGNKKPASWAKQKLPARDASANEIIAFLADNASSSMDELEEVSFTSRFSSIMLVPWDRINLARR